MDIGCKRDYIVAVDYRRPLFQLEQWSPYLAKKLWRFKSLVESPFVVSTGLNVLRLNDLEVDVEIPANRFTRSESGEIRPALLVACGEFAAKMLWQRHLNPGLEEMTLAAVQCKFLKQAFSNARAKAELPEVERERVLRKLRLGEAVEFEMPVVLIDAQEQQLAQMTCHWNLKTIRPVASLGTGQPGRSS